MMYYRGIGDLGRCFGGGLWNNGGYMRGDVGILMMIGALIVTALVIVLIVALVKRARGSRMNERDQESLELLNERFVKGEITEEDYTRMKKVLSGK